MIAPRLRRPRGAGFQSELASEGRRGTGNPRPAICGPRRLTSAVAGSRVTLVTATAAAAAYSDDDDRPRTRPGPGTGGTEMATPGTWRFAPSERRGRTQWHGAPEPARRAAPRLPAGLAPAAQPAAPAAQPTVPLGLGRLATSAWQHKARAGAARRHPGGAATVRQPFKLNGPGTSPGPPPRRDPGSNSDGRLRGGGSRFISELLGKSESSFRVPGVQVPSCGHGRQ